ncbi:MAG: PKD domain-containing protein [Thermoplasmata archaeon]
MPRALLLTAVVALAIVAVLGGGFVSAASGVGAPLSGAGTHSTHPTSDATAAGTALLKAAVASVNAASARLGSASTCAVISGTAAACGGSTPRPLSKLDAGPRANFAGAPDSFVRPAPTSPPAPAAPSPSPTPAPIDPTWYNVTTQLTTASGGVIPAVGPGSGMAFDPLLGEVVLFAGTTVTADGPFVNETWTYNGITWTDLTGTLPLAPSVRWYPGFDYDPAMGGVILVGGFSAANLGLNDTWLFTGTWKNISATTGMLLDASNGGGQNGAPLYEGGIGGSGAAWDPLLGGFLLTDGCTDPYCDSAYALSWLLNSTGWWTISFGPGWGLANPVPDYNATWLGYTVMAWDPTDQYMVLFGGLDYYAGLPENYTYTYSTGVYTGSAALNANWDNLTGMDMGPDGAPAGRDAASMTWDAQLGGIFMTGGYNYTVDYGYNDTWEFVGGLWYTLAPAPAAFSPGYGYTLAVNSTHIGVFVVGGFRYGAPAPDYGSQDEWVFETPPQATLTETPTPVDLGTEVNFTAGWTLNTGTGYAAGWNVSYGNGHYGTSRAATGVSSATAYTKVFPYTYPAAGMFTATVTWSDFFYIDATSASVSPTVNPALGATITASAMTITAGGTVTFTTSPTGGSGTYTYAWSFGDATTSTVQDPAAHTFTKAGTYVVNLTVMDSLDHSVKAASVTITVNAAPSPSSFSLGSTGTYLVIGLVLLVVVVVAIVLLMRRKKPAPAAQAWQSAPPATGGAPPPGAGGSPPPPPS